MKSFHGKNNQLYMLKNVVSKKENALHQEIVGHICIIDQFVQGYRGIFYVCEDDGWHTVNTSGVQDIDIESDGKTITVFTMNSVYTFCEVEIVTADVAEKEECADE